MKHIPKPSVMVFIVCVLLALLTIAYTGVGEGARPAPFVVEHKLDNSSQYNTLLAKDGWLLLCLQDSSLICKVKEVLSVIDYDVQLITVGEKGKGKSPEESHISTSNLKFVTNGVYDPANIYLISNNRVYEKLNRERYTGTWLTRVINTHLSAAKSFSGFINDLDVLNYFDKGIISEFAVDVFANEADNYYFLYWEGGNYTCSDGLTLFDQLRAISSDNFIILLGNGFAAEDIEGVIEYYNFSVQVIKADDELIRQVNSYKRKVGELSTTILFEIDKQFEVCGATLLGVDRCALQNIDITFDIKDQNCEFAGNLTHLVVDELVKVKIDNLPELRIEKNIIRFDQFPDDRQGVLFLSYFDSKLYATKSTGRRVNIYSESGEYETYVQGLDLNEVLDVFEQEYYPVHKLHSYDKYITVKVPNMLIHGFDGSYNSHHVYWRERGFSFDNRRVFSYVNSDGIENRLLFLEGTVNKRKPVFSFTLENRPELKGLPRMVQTDLSNGVYIWWEPTKNNAYILQDDRLVNYSFEGENISETLNENSARLQDREGSGNVILSRVIKQIVTVENYIVAVISESEYIEKYVVISSDYSPVGVVDLEIDAGNKGNIVFCELNGNEIRLIAETGRLQEAGYISICINLSN